MRSGVVESRHRGHLVAIGPNGQLRFAVGNPDAVIFPRSTNKPLQAAAMVDLGLDVDDDLIAVACASHAGLPMHVEAVRRLLTSAGLGPDELDNTPDLPLDTAAARALLAAGGGPDRLHQNCSGNHAAMLATCVRQGWPTHDYLNPTHPLQLAIRRSYEFVFGTTMSAAAVDGCGAPLYAVPLKSLACGYGAFASSDAAPAQRRVADAMRNHPDLVDGPGRAASGLMQAVPGLVAKGGAEGVYAVALADGTALAVKIEDGAARACPPVIVAALARLGVDVSALQPWASAPVFGHGEVVGEVLAAQGLCESA